MNLEEELRVTLHDRAADPAVRPDLLAGVDAGIRRDRRRRRTIAATLAAVALAGVAAVPVVLAGRDRGAPPPPPPAATTAPVDRWVEPSWPPLRFPLRPTDVPAGIGTPTVGRHGPNMTLNYRRGETLLSVTVGPAQVGWDVEGDDEDRTVTVDGRRAVLRTAGSFDGAGPGDRYAGVRWRLADGRWVQVASYGPRTEAEVLRFARGLRPGDGPVGRAPFTFAEAPPGFTVHDQRFDEMCLNRPATMADAQAGGICLSVVTERTPPEGTLEKVTVRGRPADYYPYEGNLTVDLGAGRFLSIDWDVAAFMMSRDDWIRFAAGVRVAG